MMPVHNPEAEESETREAMAELAATVRDGAAPGPRRNVIPLPNSVAPAPPIERGPQDRPLGVYRGLPRVVRILAWVAVSVGVGIVLGLTAPGTLRRIGETLALNPGLLSWYSARALGFLAYGAMAGSVVYGLLLSTKILDAIAHRPVSFALHKELSIIGLVLAGLHAVVLAADESFAFTPRALLVPFASPYAPEWVGIGQLTFYLAAVVTLSFYARRFIGQRAWRIVHYLTFLAFVGASVHGIMAGSDSGSPWAFWVYLVPTTLAAFLLVYRIVVSIAARLVPAPVPALPRPGPLDRPGAGRRI